MKRYIAAPVVALGVLLFVFSASMTVSAVQINATDQLSVTVNISKKTIVDVSPASLSWGTSGSPLDPGSAGVRKDIQLENLGSVNLTHVWFNNSVPSTRPFGTGNPANYDAGNWIAVTNDTDGYQWSFPSRKEFNASSRIIYLTGPGGNQPPDTATNEVRYGRFRNTSFEYFWAVDCDDGGTADDCTDDNVYIGTSPHTASSTGDADLQDNSHALTSITVDGQSWGVADVSFNGLEYCFATNKWANVTRWTKWDIEAPGAEANCNNGGYFLNASASGISSVVPGESLYARTKAFVPYGVPYDFSAYTGTLTVAANTLN